MPPVGLETSVTAEVEYDGQWSDFHKTRPAGRIFS
jgi:hypothetical protein